MQSHFTISIFLAGLGAILFAAKAIVVKISYEYGASPDVVLTLRMVFALPIFWIAVWWHQKIRPQARPLKKDVIQVSLIGLLGYFLSSYLDFLGLQYISIGLERIILYLTPAIVIVLSRFMLKKIILRRQYYAMGIAYLGILIVFMHDIKLSGNTVILGSTLVFMSAVVYSVYLIYAGELVARIGSIRLIAIASTSATAATCIQTLFFGISSLFIQKPEVYQLALVNALFCTFLPMLFIMLAVNRIGSSMTAQAGTIGPVATAFLGWYFLNEPVSVLQLIGIVIVLFGIAILISAGKAQDTREPSTP